MGSKLIFLVGLLRTKSLSVADALLLQELGLLRKTLKTYWEKYQKPYTSTDYSTQQMDTLGSRIVSFLKVLLL